MESPPWADPARGRLGSWHSPCAVEGERHGYASRASPGDAIYMSAQKELARSASLLPKHSDRPRPASADRGSLPGQSRWLGRATHLGCDDLVGSDLVRPG